MSIARIYEIVCDVCEEPIAADTYLTEARKQVTQAGGISRPGLDLCVKCIPKHDRKLKAVGE